MVEFHVVVFTKKSFTNLQLYLYWQGIKPETWLFKKKYFLHILKFSIEKATIAI